MVFVWLAPQAMAPWSVHEAPPSLVESVHELAFSASYPTLKLLFCHDPAAGLVMATESGDATSWTHMGPGTPPPLQFCPFLESTSTPLRYIASAPKLGK